MWRSYTGELSRHRLCAGKSGTTALLRRSTLSTTTHDGVLSSLTPLCANVRCVTFFMAISHTSIAFFPCPGRTSDSRGPSHPARSDAAVRIALTPFSRAWIRSVRPGGGRRPFVGDLDRVFHAVDVKAGAPLWQTRLPTSAQSFPVSFSVNGKQYIAVSTGLGGGSPRQVPLTIAPDVHHPASGNGLYVFALPNSK
jgi:hypothetical protein